MMGQDQQITLPEDIAERLRYHEVMSREVRGWRAFVARRMTNRSGTITEFAGLRSDGILIQGSIKQKRDAGEPIDLSQVLEAIKDMVERSYQRQRLYSYLAIHKEEGWLNLSRDEDRMVFARSESPADLTAWYAKDEDGPETTRVIDALTTGRKHLTDFLVQSADPAILDVLDDHQDFGVGFYNWLAGIEEGRKPGELVVEQTLALRRQQAAMAYRILGPLFRHSKELMTAIDSGAELSRAIVEEMRIPSSVLKRIRTAHLPLRVRDDENFPAWDRVQHMARVLNALDTSLLPTTMAEFDNSIYATDACQVLSRHAVGDLATHIRDMRSNWPKVAELARVNGTDAIGDLAHYLEDTLLAPALYQGLLREGVEAQAAEHQVREHLDALRDESDSNSEPCRSGQILTGFTARQAMEAVDRWHRNLGRLNVDLKPLTPSVEWTPYTGPIALSGCVVAEELSSAATLHQEGVDQKHCVGGYALQVQKGNCLVYSLRKDGRILSTVEIHPDGREEGDFQIWQNYAVGNSTPPPEAVRAARELRTRLMDRPAIELDNYRGALFDQEIKREAAGTYGLVASAGYEASDRASLERAWERLKEFLPKASRNLGLDRWTDDAKAKMKDYAPAPEPPRQLPPPRRTIRVRDIIG